VRSVRYTVLAIVDIATARDITAVASSALVGTTLVAIVAVVRRMLHQAERMVMIIDENTLRAGILESQVRSSRNADNAPVLVVIAGFVWADVPLALMIVTTLVAAEAVRSPVPKLESMMMERSLDRVLDITVVKIIFSHSLMRSTWVAVHTTCVLLAFLAVLFSLGTAIRFALKQLLALEASEG